MDDKYPDSMLLADSGYPGDGRLLTPFKRSKNRKEFSKEQEDFNALHARARVVIEHVNGQLKVDLSLFVHLPSHIGAEQVSVSLCPTAVFVHRCPVGDYLCRYTA